MEQRQFIVIVARDLFVEEKVPPKMRSDNTVDEGFELLTSAFSSVQSIEIFRHEDWVSMSACPTFVLNKIKTL